MNEREQRNSSVKSDWSEGATAPTGELDRGRHGSELALAVPQPGGCQSASASHDLCGARARSGRSGRSAHSASILARHTHTLQATIGQFTIHALDMFGNERI